MNDGKKARVIAFYLPQFHPIPENDAWWGKGFTEWTNVGKAKPLFRGHYQPRVPADLGYYDLRMPEVREAQAQMAKEAGVEGFMYWHYWFGNGKRLLDRPFNEVLESGKPDFPFCLAWANHSWTTHSWNSTSLKKKDTIIIEQKYLGEADYIAHFYAVLPALKDKRYIKIDDKPLFMIYAPLDFPEVSKFIDIWRKLALENGLKGLHLIARSYGWVENNQKILDLGFDGINSNGQWESEIRVKGRYSQLIQSKISNKLSGSLLLKYNYENIIKYFFNEQDKRDNIYPTIIPQWDRTPRSGKKGVVYYNCTPELFGTHVENALTYIENKPSEHKILFLKSWNEWAEGNYVEPDLRYGNSFLRELQKQIM